MHSHHPKNMIYVISMPLSISQNKIIYVIDKYRLYNLPIVDQRYIKNCSAFIRVLWLGLNAE
jgi:hypothetical protein